jgi:Fur family ferric uptake transcriptional regulator
MDSNGVDAGLLRSRYRLTKQRAAVLNALDDGAHLTAESLLERVRAQLPGVSLGTIYRTVDILREIGLVQIFTHNGLAARYEASLSKHHHLVCNVCHDITNVHLPTLGSVVNAIATQYHYDDTDASLVVTGRCANCAREAPPTHIDSDRSERLFEETSARRE